MRLWRLAVLAAALETGPAIAQVPPLTAQELTELRADGPSYRSYPQQPLARWEDELRAAMAAPRGSPDRAADMLAPRFGMAPAQMRELVRLWLTARARYLSLEPRPAESAELRRRLLQLLREAPRGGLLLQAVGESLDRLNECSADDFAALMAGSRDAAADAWAIANSAPCGANFLRAAAAAPDRAMPALIRLVHYGDLREARDRLPLYQWLTTPAALERIAEADRPAASAWLHARTIDLLLDTGLTARALAIFDALPEDVRAHVLAGPPATVATIDGLPVAFEETRPDELVLPHLAAAYALAGRTGEAETLLARADMTAARRAFACATGNGGPSATAETCRNLPYGQEIGSVIDLLLVDHFLHRPGDDPYLLAESVAGGGGANTFSGATAELRCRVFSEAQYEDMCEGARRIVLGQAAPEDGGREQAELRAAIEALPLPGLAAIRQSLEAELAAVAAARPELVREENRGSRATVLPAPSPFAELPLPPQYRSAAPSETSLPRGMASLPDGFIPLRVERNGQRAVAVSVSQTYDPTGEVSGGGYWVHLSQDGGRHWQRPLYTGLAERFPYVVARSSRLPLIDGDALNLEVVVAEIDTASITYPPVGLRTRRRAADLYLRIPLAELARDQDGDGLTDIAERNLLLDRTRTDGGTPFVVGSDAGASCTAPSAERLALVGLLGQLFGGAGRALVEPLDRPAEDALTIGGWGGAATATDAPVFLRGNPRDFVCLRPHRLMIVYGEEDIAALARFRPDFHAIAVPRIVFNRARDRGYVVWSAGWTGGTYGLRLVDGRWIFETLSEWIT